MSLRVILCNLSSCIVTFFTFIAMMPLSTLGNVPFGYSGSLRYIREVSESLLQATPHSIFKQENVRAHVERIV